MSKSLTTTKQRRLPAVHPGTILHAEFLEPLGMSQYRLSSDIGVPPKRISEIVRGRRAVTADTALRLARRLGTTAQFWMNLQTRYDLETTEDAIGRRVEREVRPHAA